MDTLNDAVGKDALDSGVKRTMDSISIEWKSKTHEEDHK